MCKHTAVIGEWGHSSRGFIMRGNDLEKTVMSVFLTTIVSLAVFTATLVDVSGQTNRTRQNGAESGQTKAAAGDLQFATFGTGCFWCTEAVFQQLDGVFSVESGYSGGHIKNPSYKAVCTGLTGHAEVVRITYDQNVISYDELLEVFWGTHDPTTPNRQGVDIGPQYRSVIFHHNDRQKQLAYHYKSKLDRAGAFRAPIVTEISPFREFYSAEAYHQEYYERNKRQAYCTRVIQPKLTKLKKVFRDKLKTANKSPRKVTKTKAEWGAVLTEQQFYVTRRKGTEAAYSGRYWNHKADGTYKCVCCGLPLFDSTSKFESGTGWPSFWIPSSREHLNTEMDHSDGTARIEVKCARCDAHLGHVFNDGPAPTGLRYCINSVALQFGESDK